MCLAVFLDTTPSSLKLISLYAGALRLSVGALSLSVEALSVWRRRSMCDTAVYTAVWCLWCQQTVCGVSLCLRALALVPRHRSMCQTVCGGSLWCQHGTHALRISSRLRMIPKPQTEKGDTRALQTFSSLSFPPGRGFQCSPVHTYI